MGDLKQSTGPHICPLTHCITSSTVCVCERERSTERNEFVFMALKEWESKYRALSSSILHCERWAETWDLHTHRFSQSYTNEHTRAHSDTHPFTFPAPPSIWYLRLPNMQVLACVWMCACNIKFLQNRWDRLCVICDWVKYHVFSLMSLTPYPPGFPKPEYQDKSLSCHHVTDIEAEGRQT